jgi:O-antigen/teichoic acid export membrane protein
VATVVMTAMTMVVGLLTGVIIARTLGPDGRGALAAVLTAPQVLGWLCSLNCGKAVSFALSRDATLGAKLLTTCLLVVLPVGAIAVLIGELAVPWFLSAQPPETLELARLYMPTVVLVLLSDLVLGILLGDQDFRYFNVLPLAHAASTAAAYVLLWQGGQFTVASALATQAAMSGAVLVVATIRVVRRHGLAKPDLDLGCRTLWYAIRTHGSVVSGIVTQRLDLLIIPAFLAASSVGFYALATNLSWLVVSVSGPLATIMMPAATHRGTSGRALVINSLRATVLIGAVLGGGLFLFADLAVRIVYGPGFADSVPPLRILLPGVVLYAAAGVFLNGLYAENRPFTATVAHMLGMATTVIGLLAFLRSGGILAAAIVSTVAYALVFVTSAVLYRRAAELEWRTVFPSPTEIRAGLRGLQAICLGPRSLSTTADVRKVGE